MPTEVEPSLDPTERKQPEIWFAHFPFAQPSACPSMSRLPHPLHSRLRGVYPERAERVERAPLGM